MPFIRVTIAGTEIDASAVRRLQEGTTEFMNAILRKRREVTAVLVEQVPLSGWTIGAEPVPVAAHVEANVSEGTNSHTEMSRFIQQMDSLLKEVLGPDVPLATYVIVREVKESAWGYGGVTQDHRRTTAKAAAA